MIRSGCRLLVALAVVAPGPSFGQTVDPAHLAVETVVTGLGVPTAMAFVGPSEILVTQKNDGRVRRVISGVLQAAAVLDVAVNSTNERGLLGLALDPDFVHNRHVYLFYTEASGADGGSALGNRVFRYRWDGSALVEPRLVLDLPAGPGSNHNGGVIQFGPDDRLYAIIGDVLREGKLQNDPAGAAPDDTSVILRVDRAGHGPIDNPFRMPGSAPSAVDRYYAYGIRNSFGLTFDPVTGDLWDTENGPQSMDEINRVAPGFNSGWTPLMGPDARSSASEADLWHLAGSAYSDPELSWSQPIAPTALGFVASRRLGCDLEHRLLVGNVNCGTLQRFELDASRTGFALSDPGLQDLVVDNPDTCSIEQGELEFGSGFGIVTDIENGPDGFVYVLSYSRGTIYRIRPTAPVAGDSDGDLVPAACDCDDTDAGAWGVPVELQQVRLSTDSDLALGWDDVSPVAGPGTTYTVISGSLSALRASGKFDDACTLSGGQSTPRTSDARPAPLTDDAYYYLVRAGNACASGTYGDSPASPDPRDDLDLSTPPPCG